MLSGKAGQSSDKRFRHLSIHGFRLFPVRTNRWINLAVKVHSPDSDEHRAVVLIRRGLVRWPDWMQSPAVARRPFRSKDESYGLAAKSEDNSCSPPETVRSSPA